MLTGCQYANDRKDTSTKQEVRLTEENHSRLVAAQPPPQLQTSLERENLIRRLKWSNDPNKISFIYLISFGKVMAKFPVQGKVSSLNSLLTTPSQAVLAYPHRSAGSTVVLPSPDFDGSYGANPEGVFWFTPTGQYMEWAGEYFLSDAIVNLKTPPAIVYNAEIQRKVK